MHTFAHIQSLSNWICPLSIFSICNTNTHSLSAFLACCMHLISEWYCNIWCVSTHRAHFMPMLPQNKNKNLLTPILLSVSFLLLWKVEALHVHVFFCTAIFMNVQLWNAICMVGKEVPTVPTYERKDPCWGTVRSTQTAMFSDVWIRDWHFLYMLLLNPPHLQYILFS